MASSRFTESDDDAIYEQLHARIEEPTQTESCGRGGAEGRGQGRGRGRGRGKRTSKVWNDFDLVYTYDDANNVIEQGVCKKCKRVYHAGSTHGTTHMRRHLHSCPNKDMTIDPSQPTLQQTMEGNLGTFSYDPAKAREYHALYLVSSQHPIK